MATLVETAGLVETGRISCWTKSAQLMGSTIVRLLQSQNVRAMNISCAWSPIIVSRASLPCFPIVLLGVFQCVMDSLPYEPNALFRLKTRDVVNQMNRELAIIEIGEAPEFGFLCHAQRLLNDEIDKITNSINPDWLDGSSKTKIKLVQRVLLPRARPGFNIVGRLLGVGGSTLHRICKVYQCSIGIYGEMSTKDPNNELVLIRSGDSRHQHLTLPLHAEISVIAEPHEAYLRFGKILTLLHKIINMTEAFEQDGICFGISTPPTEDPNKLGEGGLIDLIGKKPSAY